MLLFLNSMHSSFFQNLEPTLPTMPLGHWVTSLLINQITCSFHWSIKRHYSTSFTYAAVLTQSCRHTLMCKIGGVILWYWFTKHPWCSRKILFPQNTYLTLWALWCIGMFASCDAMFWRILKCFTFIKPIPTTFFRFLLKNNTKKQILVNKNTTIWTKRFLNVEIMQKHRCPIAKTMKALAIMMFVLAGKTEGSLCWSYIYNARLVVKYFDIVVFLLLLL